MAGLPKIALARLKANPRSSGPPVGPDAFQGAEHPDANLLSAFAEKALTESERAQVLNHLSQCADCREVAALSLPAEAEAPEPTRVAAWRRWNPWPVLRWGALAAALGAVTIVVVLQPGMWNSRPETSRITPPPTPAGNAASAPQAIPATPSPLPAPEAAQAKAQLEARASGGEMAAMDKGPGTHRDLSLDDHAARAKAKQQVTLMATARAPAPFRAENVPAVKVEQEESKGGNTLTAGALPAPSLPSAPPGKPMAAPEEAAKASADSHASQSVFRSTTQSVAVTAAGPGASSADATAGKTAPPMTAQATVSVTAQAPVVTMRASRKDMEFGAGQPAALWSVSPQGKVQRSTDAGKTLEQVHVARGIKFRAIAALGNEVWTGGTGGALFHSTDGGANWARVSLNFGGSTVTETITSIEMHDPQHLTITTASGSQWVSEDGGQNWQKKP
jgi:hypothetical protein